MTNRDLTDQEVAEFRDFISRCKTPAGVGDAKPEGWQKIERQYFNAMPRLLDARDRYRQMLKKIEWEGRNGNDDEHAYCPACDVQEPGPHKPDCELAALLGLK